MELIKETKEETLSKMYIDGIFYCYILEDEEHKVKIHGDTRIPAGRYKITYRTVGTWYERVLQKITGAKGSLWIRDVPGFEYILIHWGNTDADTAGCLLTGTSYGKYKSKGEERIRVLNSVEAYKRVHAVISKALDNKEEVWITIER